MSLARVRLVLLALLWSSKAFAVDLIMSGGTVTLGGTQNYNIVSLTNGAKVIVTPYDGVDKVNTGNLIIHANSITIDATSSVTARGAGYQTPVCGDGTGPNAAASGKGGCSLRDSGGGGAHFGNGGRGTTDCPGAGCTFPLNFEENCGNTNNGTMCTDVTNCRNGDALPTVAGQSYFHSPWAVEFGSSGGDKGCRDGDGYTPSAGTTKALAGGSGGGRIVIAGVNAGQTGTVNIAGVVNADGFRGCGNGNDSGGGGAGGSVLIVGDTVTIGGTAVITASGGLGGDSQAKDTVNAFPECAGTQLSGTCDDCGGGGGGGIVNVMSRNKATIAAAANFSVAGAKGGICPICTGEAGGGAGELQIDGGYTGEICDGFDNDFDGVIDNGFANATCGLGLCQTTIATCTAGSPPICAPASGPSPTCQGSRGTSRPRVSLILDTSASMLLTLGGSPTFGDGSVEHPGMDLSGPANGQSDDSRLFLAKGAVSQVIANYPEIDFLLARYHQDELTNRACQAAKWLECGGQSGTLPIYSQCCTYDNPLQQDNTSPTSCTLTLTRTDNTTFNQVIHQDPAAGVNRCINYAGTCGGPRRGADILVGFESDVRQYLSWLDGGETNFNAGAVPGNFCGGLSGDCELRGTGPTPIAESLRAVYDFVTPIQTVDPAAACRGYSIILVSDGGEECGGDPVAAAGELLVKSIKTYVIGVSVNAAQGTTLNAIAAAGGTTSFVPVNSPNQLLPALTSIISSSIKTELCNGIDDNCNGLTDEGFNVGAACDNGLKGKCYGTGVLECDPADSKKTRCHITMGGGSSSAETCNSIDDNCNGLTDEGDPGGGGACGSAVGACKKGVLHCQGGALTCIGATGPKPESCNGVDDDCNGATDNGVPPGGPCGSSVGECKAGSFVCMGVSGYVCQGGTGPTAETCNGKDDDCNGAIDDNVPGTNMPCNTDAMGAPLCKPGVLRCIGGKLVCQGGVAFHPPTCTCPPDDCAITDDAGASSGCPSGSACITCACRTPCAGGEFPCSGNLVCRNNFCVPPECGGKLCANTEVCVNDQCVDKCTQITCSNGQVCKPGGTCVDNNCYTLGCPTGQMCTNGACTTDPCAGVSCAVDQFCRGGDCIGSCAGVQCQKGQTCKDGACIDDPCATTTCNTGEICSVLAGAPTCIPDPCANLSCGQGRVCKEGNCIDDPCAVITCPGDPREVVCRDGQCVDLNPLMPLAPQDRVAPAGGGGWFSCSYADGGRGGGGFALLVVLALLLARRRRLA